MAWGVARHAFVAALEGGNSSRVRVVGNEKDPAHFWIERDDLDFATRHVTDIRVVVEIQRARAAR
jgi:hypothetical protein